MAEEFLKIHAIITEAPTEGLLSGFWEGEPSLRTPSNKEGIFTVPVNKLSFFDYHKGKITIGGSFTASTREQILTAGTVLDGITVVSIKTIEGVDTSLPN